MLLHTEWLNLHLALNSIVIRQCTKTKANGSTNNTSVAELITLQHIGYRVNQEAVKGLHES